jgi:hypothetical protein
MVSKNNKEYFGPDYSPEFNFEKGELVKHRTMQVKGRVLTKEHDINGKYLIVRSPDGNTMRDIIDKWERIKE